MNSRDYRKVSFKPLQEPAKLNNLKITSNLLLNNTPIQYALFMSWCDEFRMFPSTLSPGVCFELRSPFQSSTELKLTKLPTYTVAWYRFEQIIKYKLYCITCTNLYQTTEQVGTYTENRREHSVQSHRTAKMFK